MALKGNEVVLLVRSLPTKRLVANFDNDDTSNLENQSASIRNLCPADASGVRCELQRTYVATERKRRRLTCFQRHSRQSARTPFARVARAPVGSNNVARERCNSRAIACPIARAPA